MFRHFGSSKSSFQFSVDKETRGANEAIDFNDELRNRREKLAALR
ncbi:hypothetical protein ACUOFC_15595, partial [Escherichia sp. TWPC-MK]